MKLSNQLAQDHSSGDFGQALEGYTEKAQLLELDAARYQWIRNNPQWIGYDADYRPDEVDAVIDTAMANPEDQT